MYIPTMSYDEALKLVSEPQLPEQTKTYMPVANAKLFERIRDITSDYLGKEPVSYGAQLGAKGNQMFGSVLYANGSDEMKMQVGFRNSYNKTLPVGLIAGASIIVCSNGMFIGDIQTVRKHTANVWNDIEELVAGFCKNIIPTYDRINEKKESMRAVIISDMDAAHLLGEMFVLDGVLTTPMLNIAVKEWHKPSHNAFKDRNAWSLHNACTEALKKAHPAEIMERHQQLDEFFVEKNLMPGVEA